MTDSEEEQTGNQTKNQTENQTENQIEKRTEHLKKYEETNAVMNLL